MPSTKPSKLVLLNPRRDGSSIFIDRKTAQAILAQAEVIRAPGDRDGMLSIAHPARPFSPSGQRCHHPTAQKAPRAGSPMKRVLRSTVSGLMYIGLLLAIPGLVIGAACEKVLDALEVLW